MNILVILRALRDPAGITVNRKAQKVFVNRESFIINPSDRNALEAALALAGPEDAVTAAAYGGAPAEDALRQARATGAGRAIWLTEPRLAADARSLTMIWQRLVAHLGAFDLVLLGAEVLDADLAQVGPRLAAALDWPFVEAAYQISMAPGGGLALAVASAGGFRLLGVDAPLVASVARNSNKPRFAPAAQIITTYTSADAVEIVTLEDLGLEAEQMAPVTAVRGQSFPPERTLGRIVEGEDAVGQMAHELRRQ